MTQDSTRSHRRRGEAFWRRALMAHGQSGLSQTEFCRRNALAPSTFHYWRRRLRQSSSETTPAASPAAAFAELKVRPELCEPGARTEAAEAFELSFPNGLQLKIPLGVEGRALAEVLWALEATGSC